jgi:hypothetical protein
MPFVFLPKRRQIKYNLAPRFGAGGEVVSAAPLEMSMKIKMLALAGFAASLFVPPAIAHHSHAMYDDSKMDSLLGTVSVFEWRNPHGWLHLTVTDEAGNELEWSFEMGSIGQMARDGWAEDTVGPGDAIEIRFHPIEDGSNGGQLRFVRLPGGETICQGIRACRLEGTG